MMEASAGGVLQVQSADAFARCFDATNGQIADLENFHDLLVEWNQRMNLVGPSALSQFWQRHVLDSAQLFHVEQSALLWADVGTGAGFPGIVLAILLKARSGARVHLIESMSKRVGFLRHVVEALSLPAEIHHGRAEALEPPAGLKVVTARACAPLPRLLDYTAHFFKAGATGLFLKGGGVEEELAAARRDWTFRSELIESRSDPAGRLVRISGLKRRG